MRFLNRAVFWVTIIFLVLVCIDKVSVDKLILIMLITQLIFSIALSDIEKKVTRLERGRGFDNLFNPALSLQKILEAVKKKREEKKDKFTIINKDN